MDDKTRWNARYAAQAPVQIVPPNPFLCEYLGLLPSGKVLDLAMGDGHNAVFLAQQGLSVTGIDISDVAVQRARQLAQLLGVSLPMQTVDLRSASLPVETYDAIVCFYYLDRELFPQIVAALKPGGVVMYETFTADQAQYGQPTNPAYLLRPNELLEVFRRFRIRVYRDLVLDGPKAIASIIGEKTKSSPDLA